MSSTSLIKAVRLDEEQVTELLDRLDEASSSGAAEQTSPGSKKYTYRSKIRANIQNTAGATAATYLVPGRNISQEGLSFLFGGFIHARTKCELQLTTHHGAWSDLTGTVADCRYVQGNVHEVTVRFDHVIDPAMYCSEAVQMRVLLVEDDPTVMRLGQMHLKQLNATVDQVTDGEEAVERALSNVYDVILMDMEMPVLDGFAATRQLRDKGYTGMIAAMTALTQPSDRERCLEAGCDRYIPKPYTHLDLKELLKSLHEEPLFSSFSNDPAMAEILNTFVLEIAGTIRELEEALAAKDTPQLARLTRLLKAQGSGYGFDIISQTAERIESAILGGASLQDISENVVALIRLCLQARSSVRLGGQTSGETAKPAAAKQ